ncbi:Hypothetical predicted protein [Octopus vulgaris]|uniref:Uncharacterized protein n=2 Tax=Octopus TaxID=6643 RepID=A0AA36AS79_OCTVU|nr:protein MNN4-like [Octopus sinensis]CAI9721336.1 Hypothetical predicted protein [Octopus vulgaris]
MPKKKKKREKVDDGLTLAQRIELKKKQKEENPPVKEEAKPEVASTSAAEGKEEKDDGNKSQPINDDSPAKEDQTNKQEEEKMPQQNLEANRNRSVDASHLQMYQEQVQNPFCKQKSIRNEDQKNVYFDIPQKSSNKKSDFSYGYLPQTICLPEQTYTARRAYQVFCQYHTYIDSISQFVENNLKNIIVMNSQRYSEDNQCLIEQGEDFNKLRSLQTYLLSESMQMEMDRFLADL